MKYAILTGETSSDRHGRDLMQTIKEVDNDASFAYVGGRFMDQIGGDKILDIKSLSVMGFWEVIKKLPSIMKSTKLIKNRISSFNPDVVILIDNAGLNLRLAKWASKLNFKTVYYILPKAWAWNSKRTKALSKYSDLNLSILPFEEAFFTKHNVKTHFVGNPSKNQISNILLINKEQHLEEKAIPNKPILALLPGSRKQEIKRMLPMLIGFGNTYKANYDVVISRNPEIDLSFYETAIESGFRLEPDFYKLLSAASYAIVTSGTATLETALFNVPQVVAYKTSLLSYSIAKSLVKVDYISLVNLIAEFKIVDELIQHDFNLENLEVSFSKLPKIGSQEYCTFYSAIETKLGNHQAAKQAAKLIHELLVN